MSDRRKPLARRIDAQGAVWIRSGTRPLKKATLRAMGPLVLPEWLFKPMGYDDEDSYIDSSGEPVDVRGMRPDARGCPLHIQPADYGACTYGVEWRRK